MKVFFDHYIFVYQRYGGVSKYHAELLRNIAKEDWECSVLFSNNQYLQDFKLLPYISFLPKLNFKGKERLMSNLSSIYTKYKLKHTDWDVFHTTGHATNFTKSIKGKPLVVTCHDLLYELFHKNDPRRERVIQIEKNNVHQADKVIAISQNTKKDLINYWGVDESKIDVVYHGIDKVRLPVSSERLIPNPYVLYVGARVDYKNFENFSRAFALLSEKNKDLRLVCTGVEFKISEIEFLKSLHVLDKVLHFPASEMQMAQLYNDAEMFVYPSLYEGFGMPILEAMLYDCPVLLSNTSCFPEIAKDAALYFNPLELEDMLAQMQSLIGNQTLKEKLSILSRERLTDFSWKNCADQHLQIYKSLI